MKDITIKDIIDLATQDVSDPDAELKKVYEWYHERKIMIIKGTISISVSLIIALSIAYYKSEIKVDNWELIYPLILSLLFLFFGFFELLRVRKIGKKYVAAITLLNRLKKIKPFLLLYRNILNR